MPREILASAVYASTTALQARRLVGKGEGFGHEGISFEELYRSECLFKTASWKLKLKLITTFIKYIINDIFVYLFHR